MDTGSTKLIMTLEKMAAIAYPDGSPSSGCLYFFREGWNPSGKRFIAFLKDPDNALFKAFSMTAEGTDVRYLYYRPSHHAWQDDNYIIDFGEHVPPGGDSPQKGYFLFKDDGTGSAKIFSGTRIDGLQLCFPARVAMDPLRHLQHEASSICLCITDQRNCLFRWQS